MTRSIRNTQHTKYSAYGILSNYDTQYTDHFTIVTLSTRNTQHTKLSAIETPSLLNTKTNRNSLNCDKQHTWNSVLFFIVMLSVVILNVVMLIVLAREG
jgi:hypothetical protein